MHISFTLMFQMDKTTISPFVSHHMKLGLLRYAKNTDWRCLRRKCWSVEDNVWILQTGTIGAS